MPKMEEVKQIIKYCEELICKIEDIVSAKIITNSDGKISNIHAVSNSNRDPKQIVRDIESAIITSFSSNENLNIAQLNKQSEIISNIRLKIEGIATQRLVNQFEAKVILSDSMGNIYEGKVSGDCSYQNRLRIIAKAAVCAIAQFLQVDVIFSLEDVLELKIRDREVIIALLSIKSNDTKENLLGSALVKQAKSDAVIEAVLDAFRKTSFLIKKKQAED